MSRKWEYCSLVSHGIEAEGDELQWLCRVTYFTPEGATSRVLKSPEDDGSPDTFERAMAQLGTGGWELVTLQHQLVQDSLHLERQGVGVDVPVGLSFSSFGVAYFKRRRKPDRPIGEPAIVIAE